jgi:hypothetical protein
MERNNWCRYDEVCNADECMFVGGGDVRQRPEQHLGVPEPGQVQAPRPPGDGAVQHSTPQHFPTRYSRIYQFVLLINATTIALSSIIVYRRPKYVSVSHALQHDPEHVTYC